MSGRAFRKLQRAQDLAVQREDNSSSGDEEAVAPVVVTSTKPKLNLFDLLVGDDDQEKEEEEEEEDDQQQTDDPEDQQRWGVDQAAEEAASAQSGRGKSAKKSDKKKRKQQGKSSSSGPGAARGKGKGDFTMEELEESIRQLGELPTHESKVVDQSKATAAGAKKHLLSIDARNMDPDIEMRRLFGSKIINEEVSKRRYAKIGRRTLLATPRDTWPRLDSIGLDMELVSSDDGVLLYTFKHSARYQEIQKQFYLCLKTHDPSNLTNLMHMYPAHVDSLLQLSEVIKHSGDIAVASELIERALYVFERSMHPSFNLTAAKCQLSYDRIENRSFFIALLRRIQFIGRSGCWRTALEFTKLLLSLSHKQDPLAVYSMIDFYALKSGEYSFLLQLYNEYGEVHQLAQMPNFLYSIALAQYHLEVKAKGGAPSADQLLGSSASVLLQNAMLQYPGLLQKLFAKNSAYLDKRFAQHPFVTSHVAPTANLNVLYDLYVERSATLWKEPEVIQWVKDTLPAVVERMKDPNDASIVQGRNTWQALYVPDKYLSRNLYRHLILLEFNFTAALPQELRNNIEMHDPLPPPNVQHLYSEYLESLNRNGLASTSIPATSDPLMSFLRTLLPWVNGVQANDLLDHEARELMDAQTDGVMEALRNLPENVASAVRDMRLLERLGINSRGTEGAEEASNNNDNDGDAQDE
ncbi:hypothetical protein RI367_000091 [Sorochytrium milnesiophthora]